MKNYFTCVATLLVTLGSMAQTQVDLSELSFKETESQTALYVQYAAKTRLSTETTSQSKIVLDLGSGFAEVVQSQENRLKVRAEIVISLKNKKKIAQELEDLELYIEHEGSNVKLVSKFDYNNEDKKIFKGFFSSPERKINVKIFIPKDLPVKLKDRSGDLAINNITNDVRLSDGSGSIRIDGLDGDLNLKDNAGDIALDNLNQRIADADSKTVKIIDSSGSIYLKNANGQTEIDDSSGDIEITNLGGSLEIDDTSGSIRAENVGGDTIVDDTSGEITINSVDGSITISDTSGGIYVDTVSKDVTLKRDGSGAFSTKNVQGSINKRG